MSLVWIKLILTAASRHCHIIYHQYTGDVTPTTELVGFEPTNTCLLDERSNQLS